MPFLVILKRFEVWLLVSLVVALFLFAFRPEPTIGTDPVATADKPASVSAVPEPADTADPADPPKEAFTVEDVSVTPTKGGMIVELTLSGRSPSGKDIALDDAGIMATTGEGETVNRFFEPFRKPAVLLASGDSLATLKWWLERPAGVIWLDLEGQRVKAELP